MGGRWVKLKVKLYTDIYDPSSLLIYINWLIIINVYNYIINNKNCVYNFFKLIEIKGQVISTQYYKKEGKMNRLTKRKWK